MATPAINLVTNLAETMPPLATGEVATTELAAANNMDYFVARTISVESILSMGGAATLLVGSLYVTFNPQNEIQRPAGEDGGLSLSDYEALQLTPYQQEVLVEELASRQNWQDMLENSDSRFSDFNDVIDLLVAVISLEIDENFTENYSTEEIIYGILYFPEAEARILNVLTKQDLSEEVRNKALGLVLRQNLQRTDKTVSDPILERLKRGGFLITTEGNDVDEIAKRFLNNQEIRSKILLLLALYETYVRMYGNNCAQATMLQNEIDGLLQTWMNPSAIQASSPRLIPIPILIEAMRDRNPDIARDAVVNLRTHGKAAISALPDLLICLKSSNLQLVQVTLLAINSIGPEAISAGPALLELLPVAQTQDSTLLFSLTLITLASIGEKRGIPILTDLMTHPNPTIQKEAAEALAIYGPAATAAIDALLYQAQNNLVNETRLACIYALGEIGHGSAFYPLMGLALYGNREDIKEAAWSAFRKTTPKIFSKPLQPKTEDKTAEISNDAKDLIPFLYSNSPAVRRFTAQALGKMGVNAAEAKSDLSKVSQRDTELDVRIAAAWALRQIEAASQIH